MKAVALLLLILLCSLHNSLYAQKLPPQESLLPEEYDPNEFAPWLLDLRRYEVVALGSFPFTFLISSLIYDFSLAAAHGFDPQYNLGSQRGQQDIKIILGAAVGAALGVATADLLITTSKRKKSP